MDIISYSHADKAVKEVAKTNIEVEKAKDSHSTSMFGFVHSTTASEDYTIASGTSMISAGDIEVPDDVTITIEDGATWAVI